MPKVTLPNADRTKGGARFVPGAILEAVEILEVGLDIEVKLSAGIGTRGTRRSRNGGHTITVSTYLDAAQLNVTLWHELVHCAQAERAENLAAWSTQYHQETARRGYTRNRYEVEARAISEDFAADLALAK